MSDKTRALTNEVLKEIERKGLTLQEALEFSRELSRQINDCVLQIERESHFKASDKDGKRKETP